MKVVKRKHDDISIVISDKERMMINNALNEVCNTMWIVDYESTVGFSREEIKRLLREFRHLKQTIKGS